MKRHLKTVGTIDTEYSDMLQRIWFKYGELETALAELAEHECRTGNPRAVHRVVSQSDTIHNVIHKIDMQYRECVPYQST